MMRIMIRFVVSVLVCMIDMGGVGIVLGRGNIGGNFPSVVNQMAMDPAAVTTETNMFMSLAKDGSIVASSTKGAATGTSLASATYKPTLQKQGWDFLNVKTDECEDKPTMDPMKAYAAGFAEGYLTRQAIHDFRYNTEIESGVNEKPAATQDALSVLNQQDEFVALHDCVDGSNTEDCKYNHQAYLIHMQMHGILQGHNASIKKHYPNGPKNQQDTETPTSLTMYDLLRLNCDGAIKDYLDAFHSKQPRASSSLIEKRRGFHTLPNGMEMPGRCSAMVKLLKDSGGSPSDIYLGHSTWEDFSESTRTWKIYDFPFCGVETTKISMSGYPGAISSTDDWYLTKETQLAITETSLGSRGRPKAWKKSNFITKESRHVPDYVHIMVITRLARDGWDWMTKFTDSKNSLLTGVYNSQWLLVDYDKFLRRPDHESLGPWTFMMLETAPGASQWRDMTTDLMKTTYWGSFNEPWFPEVKEALNLKNDEYSSHPRWIVFNEKQKDVDSFEKMKMIMRSASDIETINGRRKKIGYGSNICSRPDLDMGHLVGGSDTKIVSAGMMSAGPDQDPVCLAINGPSTVGNDNPFDFRKHPDARRQGLPNIISWPWQFVTSKEMTVQASEYIPPTPVVKTTSAAPATSPPMENEERGSEEKRAVKELKQLPPTDQKGPEHTIKETPHPVVTSIPKKQASTSKPTTAPSKPPTSSKNSAERALPTPKHVADTLPGSTSTQNQTWGLRFTAVDLLAATFMIVFLVALAFGNCRATQNEEEEHNTGAHSTPRIRGTESEKLSKSTRSKNYKTNRYSAIENDGL